MHNYFLRVKTITGAAVLAVGLTGGASHLQAGPEPVSKNVVETRPDFNWSGFYLGLNVGGMLNNYDFSGPNHFSNEIPALNVASKSGDNSQGGFFEDVDTFDQLLRLFGTSGQGSGSDILTFFVPDHSDRDGSVMGGAQAGYQRQFGHFVIGLEGTVDRTSSSATNLFRAFGGSELDLLPVRTDTAFEASRRAQTDWTAAAMGKLGYAQGRWLFYVIGGASWCNVDTTAHDIATTTFTLDRMGGTAPSPNLPLPSLSATTSNTNISKDDDTRFGWTLGGGIEVAASRMLSVALEYRHSDFGSESYHYNSHGGPIYPGSTSVDLSSDQVTVKMNLLLNNFFFGQGDMMAGSEPASGGSERLAFANVRGGDKEKIVQMTPAPEFSWTGIYAGAHVGGIWNNFDFGSYDTDVDVFEQLLVAENSGLISQAQIAQYGNQPRPELPVPFPVNVLSFRTPGNGSGSEVDDNSDMSFIGGGQLGYNYQWGHWVFGLEGDFSGSDTSGAEKFSQTGVAFIDDVPFEGVATLNSMRIAQTEWSASLRGRVGWAHGPLMVYATGGATWTDVRVSANDSLSTDIVVFPITTLGTIVSKNQVKDEEVEGGWTAGGGIEWAFTKASSMALEYRHNWYGDNGFSFDAHKGPIFPGSSSVDLDGDQLTFRVNLLLGHIAKQ